MTFSHRDTKSRVETLSFSLIDFLQKPYEDALNIRKSRHAAACRRLPLLSQERQGTEEDSLRASL
jgi:hypothetical protein